MLVGLFALQGCATTGRAPAIVVGIDGVHGQAWPGLPEALSAQGFKPVTIDHPLDDKTLEKIGVLLVAAPSRSYKKSEIGAVERFVKQGGGLLCAGQAWSWTYKEYGNKPINTYPLNQLGRVLQFHVTEHNIGAPVHLKTEIMAGIGEITHTDWWPSEIQLLSDNGRAVLLDEQQRVVAGFLPLGDGRVVVYGHDALLRDNPAVLAQSISFAAKLP